ncbi:MAG: hypothetical protein ABTR92_04915 [Candidatus Accumulibacter phosphatis]|jgi:hypothetical protein|uniref:hypothetical protein n=1 Tax=Candidatus Accumulibacter sp. ACC012 TaxID=2823332 RepID=UPI0025BD2B2E|nr:hypothetical protein [Candidatus Accumulibacter sp. ACC012]
MSVLERRTAKLEASRPDANQINFIIRRVIGNEVVRVVIGNTVVDRRAGEAEAAFMERSKVEALAGTVRRPCRMILLGKGGRR